MLIPVRCFCNKPIGHLWNTYKEKVKTEKPGTVLDELNIKRYCCRRMFLGHIDIIDNLLNYSNNPGEKPVKKYIPTEELYGSPPMGEDEVVEELNFVDYDNDQMYGNEIINEDLDGEEIDHEYTFHDNDDEDNAYDDDD